MLADYCRHLGERLVRATKVCSPKFVQPRFAHIRSWNIGESLWALGPKISLCNQCSLALGHGVLADQCGHLGERLIRATKVRSTKVMVHWRINVGTWEKDCICLVGTYFVDVKSTI